MGAGILPGISPPRGTPVFCPNLKGAPWPELFLSQTFSQINSSHYRKQPKLHGDHTMAGTVVAANGPIPDFITAITNKLAFRFRVALPAPRRQQTLKPTR